jgi:hypothetical protein
MSTLLPTVLWYGGLLGAGLAALLVLWALALYAIKRATGPFVSGILGTALALAATSSWVLTYATGLSQGSQLLRVHAPLVRLVAASVHSRAALEDVRAVAEPSADFTAFQKKYDGHEASIESLLQAEWQFHRRGPWDEPALLYKITWDLNDVQVHHARWEKRLEALECPAAASPPALSDAIARLQERLQAEQMLAQVLGEQFDGYDLDQQSSPPVSSATVTRTLAMILGGLALLSVAAAALVWRKRPRQGIDVLVAVAAIVLVNLAGWLALGTGADQERLRADLFSRVATVYRETLDLNENLKTLMPVSRESVLPARDSGERLITDYAEYMNSVRGLAQLVRIWDRAVLTGTLDTGVVASEQIRTHEDVLNAIRMRLFTMYRQHAQLDGRITALRCRSEWFPRSDGRTREDELVALP